MELYFLDENFNIIGDLTIDFLNLQWYRKYYEVGTFSIYMLLDNYDPRAVYIYTKDRPELGVIKKTVPTIDGNQAFITVSGKFAECLLNDKVAYPTYYGTGNLETSTKACIEEFVTDITGFTIGDTVGYEDELTWQTTGEDLGDRIFELWQSYGVSYRMAFDWISSTFTFNLWQGKDRTEDQSENSTVTFSSGFKNMDSAKITIDQSIFKNYITVIGIDSDGETLVPVVVDRSDGGYQQQMYYYSSLQHDTDEQNYSEFIESLTATGEEMLNETIVATSVDVEATSAPYAYLTDYDLGDLVSIIVEKINMDITSRITGVKEVIKRNSHTVLLEIGDQKITIFKRKGLE